MQFVLIHSPFVGPLTWAPTARALEEQGHASCVPTFDITHAPAPYWPYMASRVAAMTRDPASHEPVTFVAHSAAGLLIPSVRAALPDLHVRAYVFVDAAIPRADATLAELIPAGAGATLETLRAQAEGGLLPPWGSGWPDELWETLIPDAALRARFIAEVPPVPFALYEEPIPGTFEWPDAPCCFLRFSDLYAPAEEQARRAGWRTYEIRGHHLHMLVDPARTAAALVDLATPPEPRDFLSAT